MNLSLYFWMEFGVCYCFALTIAISVFFASTLFEQSLNLIWHYEIQLVLGVQTLVTR
ncbi:MAG: hypothetical protein ACI86M_000320 [Saprospiraceae bacterium]|jgi:hypothetical protein